ncbi:MAG: energy transducer TonB [Spirochaetia bacterium]|nr:energy transducer TonB [Spirochaetia bacterium]
MQGFSEAKTREVVHSIESPLYRGIAGLAYFSDFLGLPVVAPLAVWTVFPKSRFLRTHAFYAAVLHLFSLLLSTFFHVANYTLIKESDNGMMSLREWLGLRFAGDTALSGFILIMGTGAFLAGVMVAMSTGWLKNARRVDHPFAIMQAALMAALGVPFVFYSSILWSGFGADSLIDWGRFREPTQLIPGHITLLAALWGSILSGLGRRFHIRGLSRIFARLQKDLRKTGAARLHAARLRAWIFPGWGHYYLGRRVSGLSMASLFLVLLLFGVISTGLLYGRWAESHQGLNANFTWYFLSDLGLRAATSDADLKQVFGRWVSLGVIILCMAGLVFLSVRGAVVALEAESQAPSRVGAGRLRHLLPVVPQSILMHIVVVTMLILVPVNFMTRTSGGRTRSSEPIRVIPDHFEDPEAKMRLDGGVVSGNNKPFQDTKGGTQTVKREGREFSGSGEGKGKGSEFGRPGSRQDMTYSNYISARIRGPEKWLQYWAKIPRPYSAVFEYKISASGEVFDIRIREPSRYPEADRLTVRMIEAMGRVLPPPGGRSVMVTELFWNTEPSDDSLPTDLQRRLSRAFDGRVIRDDF